jgi:glycosyltransferase involved in cell wall biosynthesis
VTQAILQVLPALVTGGVERGTVEIAEAIMQAGFRALVASAGGPLVAEIERVGARHVTLPLERKSASALLGNAGSLARLVREERVAILHARSRFPAWSALLAAKRSGARFVTTYHGAYNEGFPGKRLYNSVMARGERVIAISRFIAELVRARHGVAEERLRLIPRGVDPRRFDPATLDDARVAALRARWGGGRAVILMPGRFARWKGQLVLVDAMARLQADAVAVFVGGGGLAGEIAARAASLGIAERIVVEGHTEDMAEAMAASDVVVHASTDPEAFGRTVIEAQAMARLIIASDLGGPRETVRPGETGWLTPPGDASALAAAVDAALALPAAARAAMGEAGRALVLRDYTTAAMQARTLDVYRELL